MTRGALSYKDLRATATYSHTAVTEECYRLSTAVEDRSPWSYFSDWRLLNAFPDPQHVCYNKGVASDFVGGLLKSLCQDDFFAGATPLARINDAYVCYMQDEDSRRRDSHSPKPFTLRRFNMYSPNAFPTVSCGYKHGQVRTILHWICRQASKQVENPSQELRAHAAGCLSGFVLHLDSAGAMLTPLQQTQAIDLGQGFLNAYSVLYEFGQQEDSKIWFARPKHHVLWHIIQRIRASRANPFFQWANWLEEDFMGKASKIAKMCHPSISGLSRCLQRYVLYLHADFLRPPEAGDNTKAIAGSSNRSSIGSRNTIVLRLVGIP